MAASEDNIRTFTLVREDSDTRIRPGFSKPEYSNDYATYEEARAEAIRYLKDLIISCAKTLNEFQAANTWEKYLKEVYEK